MTARERVVPWIAALLLGVGAWQVAAAGWIHAKAVVAQRLIASAWQLARDGGPARRPWPWADMRPVARLSMPALGVDLFVLDAATPRALAFGPAHVGGTAAPGLWGNSVVVAHRDTHFEFLRRITLGEVIAVERAGGARSRYRVREITVVDKGESRVLDPADSPQLTLITCFPFDAVQHGTTLRYVVVAERVA
ncbi:MAG TPA: class GN sortase [Usitatibacter sp.]|nr:class GN sortase [Usitatibacter sp.]